VIETLEDERDSKEGDEFEKLKREAEKFEKQNATDLKNDFISYVESNLPTSPLDLTDPSEFNRHTSNRKLLMYKVRSHTAT
jgi:hypothetical protein